LDFPAVTTTKIRINCLAASDSYSRITEIEAWGGDWSEAPNDAKIAQLSADVIEGLGGNALIAQNNIDVMEGLGGNAIIAQISIDVMEGPPLSVETSYLWFSLNAGVMKVQS
jgi:hypothetical protein